MDNTTQQTTTARPRMELERHNAEQYINKLPVEILSRIFIIGDQIDQDDADSTDDEDEGEDDEDEGPYLEFQELVSHVCRHWRTIAINMPTLWTYITLSDPIPYERSAMLLARSGNTTPLEIEIDMTGDFMEGLEGRDKRTHVKRAIEALEFIVDHGGITSRWERFVIWSEIPDIVLAAIDFISSAPLDTLTTLKLLGELNDDLLAEPFARQDYSESIMFKNQPPLLRHVELYAIPSNFFFARESAPLVSNLTHLELSTIVSLPPLIGLRELLLHSPLLETLFLDMGLVTTVSFEDQPPSSVRVSMPFLHQFTLREPVSVSWGLSVLKMIDAPGVEMFSLNLTQSEELTDSIMRYIALGRSAGRLMDDDTDTGADRGSIYPSLKHFALGPFINSAAILKATLKAFQNVTRLDWETGLDALTPIQSLMTDVAVCPQLEHLRVYGVSSDDLVAVVRARATNGRPLKIVEVNSRDWEQITEDTKQLLKTELVKFGRYVDEDEDTDSEDAEEDEDEDGSIDTASSDLSDTDGSGGEWEDVETDSDS
ncbi:hypothetical protein BDV93DRAFT_525081 [Ceratobasidium sp. AG-I]|nr:hypothetical protein BDV93DRAFT_525081 [Ceratobasidium sp. AG-I]